MLTFTISRKTGNRCPWISVPGIFAALTAACLGAANISAAFAGEPAGVGSPPGFTVQKILANVATTYGRITSARGEITRIVEMQGRDPLFLKGTFAVVKPDRMRIELRGESTQVSTCDSRMYRIYFPEKKRGVYEMTGPMNDLERYVKGPGHLFGDIMGVLRTGYDLTAADPVDDMIVLKAVPIVPSDIGYILVGISPESWTIRAVEQFDTKERVVSQSRYMAFHAVGDTLFFPSTVVVTVDTGGSIAVETTYFRKIKLNVPIDNGLFKNPGDRDIDWESITPIAKQDAHE